MIFKLRILTVVSVGSALLSVVGNALFPSERIVPVVTVADECSYRTPDEYCRSEDQTFLTYPEWFLVYSPREYADLVKDHAPGSFPFMEHVGQFWQAYGAVCRVTRGNYEFNADYHLMVMIIGGSTTIEYTSKWAYEVTVGRMSHALAGNSLTEEDHISAATARQYEQFLNTEAWYSFDYLKALGRVWKEPSYFSTSPLRCLRKWERKYGLTTEYGIKTVYAMLMRRGAESAYGSISKETVCIVDSLPHDVMEMSDVRVLERNKDGSALIALPRYQRFTQAAIDLVSRRVRFLEIAGNRNAVLLSAVVSDSADWQEPLLFVQPILTEQKTSRIVFHVPVSELHSTLIHLQHRDAVIEHVYDY